MMIRDDVHVRVMMTMKLRKDGGGGV